MASGKGRYPLIALKLLVKGATDDGAEITRVALGLLSQIKRGEKIRLAGIRCTISNGPKYPVGAVWPEQAAANKHARLNLALDKVTERFGHEAISRGFARAEKAAHPARGSSDRVSALTFQISMLP